VLEEHSKKVEQETYQQIRELTRKPKINTGTIQISAGIEHSEKDKINRRWKEYTEVLYKMDTKTYTAVQKKV
jgi:GGDEF domain-containing protein